jgi:O-antigen ligase
MRLFNVWNTAKFLYLLLIFLVPLAVWNATLTAVEIKDLAVKILLPLILIFILIHFAMKKVVSRLPRSIFITGIVWLAYSFISYALWPFGSKEVFLNLFLGLSLFFINTVLINSRQSLSRILVVWQASAVIVAVYYILQNCGLDFVEWERQKLIPLGSTFTCRNHMIYFLLITYPLSIYSIIKGTKITRIIGIISLCLCIACIFISKSRIGPAVVVLAIPFYLLFLRRFPHSGTAKRVLLAFSILSIIILLSGIVYLGTIIARTDYLTLNRYSHDRLGMWKSSMGLIRENILLGSGTSSFPKLFPEHRTIEVAEKYGPELPLIHAHNEYLELVAENGILGLILFIGFISVTIRYAKKFSKDNESDSSLFVLALISILSALIFSFYSVAHRYLYCSLFFWLALALCYKSSNISATNEGIDYSAGRVLIFTAVITCFFGLWFFHISIREFRSQIYLKKSLKYSAMTHKTGHAFEEIHRAVRLNPRNTNALYQRGYLYLQINERERALGDYQKVQIVDPNFQNIHYNMGMIYYKNKEYKRAIKALGKSVRIFARFEPAILYLAESYYYSWKFKECLKICNKLLEINPKHKKAKFLKEFVEKQTNEKQ